MKRNFKVKFKNIELPKKTFLVSAVDHAEVFSRFRGILKSKGFVLYQAHYDYNHKWGANTGVYCFVHQSLLSKRNTVARRYGRLTFATLKEKVILEVIRLD